MDPLGAKPDTIDVTSISPWSASDPEGPPPNVDDTALHNAHTLTPFPLRDDLNRKVALWYTFLFI